jgi:hypothetical protein
MANKLKKAYIETTIENWNDFFLIHQCFLSRFVFRGQANAEWKLQSSLERLMNVLHSNYVDPIIPASYESRMLEEFIWKYPLYEKNIIPQKNEYIEWLTLMQHYGCPTRMLDFSHSLFVSLFMAIDGQFYEQSSIWAINSIVLRNKIFDYYRVEFNTNSTSGEELDNYIYVRANNAIESSMKIDAVKNELYIIEPRMCNERLSKQQGLFVVPSNIQNTFEDHLFSLIENKKPIFISINKIIEYSNSRSGIYSQTDIALLRFNIPKILNWKITKLLRQMNITAETLYPGLEGLARSISFLRDSMGDYQKE